jgi:hypothetical protein
MRGISLSTATDQNARRLPDWDILIKWDEERLDRKKIKVEIQSWPKL